MPASNVAGFDRRQFLLRMLAAAPAGAAMLALAGCGDSNGTSSMMPADPKDLPENKAKASLDFYRQKAGKKSR